jgi:hypothetical protein
MQRMLRRRAGLTYLDVSEECCAFETSGSVNTARGHNIPDDHNSERNGHLKIRLFKTRLNIQFSSFT